MSASKEKLRRREERENGGEKKQVQRFKTAKMRKRNNIIKSVIAAVVVVALIVCLVFNSTLLYTGVSALKVGSHSYTAAEFNYYYQNAYMSTYSSLSSTYGSLISYLIDTSKPLSEQQYSEDMTWDDYFKDGAKQTIKQVAMLVDAANAEGYTLSSDELAEVESTIASTKSSASEAGYTYSAYLRTIYGKGFTDKLYKEILTNQALAQSYSQAIVDRAAESYTDEMLMEVYDSNAETYNLITYCYYFVSGAADDEAGIDSDTAMNNAYTTAQSIAAGKTEDIFAELVAQTLSEDEQASFKGVDSVIRRNYAPSAIPSAYSEWLTSSERQYGDTTCIEGTNGYYALLFVASNHNDYNLRSFRHILVKLSTDEDTGETASDAALAAKANIDNYYAKWQEDPTEENFASLANKYSEDTGSNTNGGLYENVYMGQMVPEVENWIFDESREVGDTEIVYVSSDNYKGYHILYYVGEGEQYNLKIADALKRQEDYNAWLEARSADYEPVEKFGYRFVK